MKSEFKSNTFKVEVENNTAAFKFKYSNDLIYTSYEGYEIIKKLPDLAIQIAKNDQELNEYLDDIIQFSLKILKSKILTTKLSNRIKALNELNSIDFIFNKDMEEL